MNKIYAPLSITVVCACLLFTAPPVFAHILQTDNTIGAVLHIDPNDDPIAGSLASFFFEFKDKTNKFSPQACDCEFLITENGKQIFSQPLYANNSNPTLDNASVFFTFPKRDVYDVVVTGKPTIPGLFQPFTLTYPIRVDKVTGQQNSTESANYTLPIVLIGILCIIGGIKFFPKKKKEEHDT